MADKAFGMRKVLFVDDDDQTCELYDQLHTYWGIGQEVHTARSGQEALKILDRAKCDVVVSDLIMPDMSGLDFLGTVMENHPETARIVISGHSDHLKAAEALNVAHRYFSKPFRLEVLGTLLEQLSQYHYLLHNERVRRMIYKTGALPVLPATWIKLAELLDSPDTDITDIASIVEQDPGLTSSLLHTVNSAYFGMPRKVVACQEAIQIVGLEVVRGLMMGMKVFGFYEKSPLVKSVFGNIWEHSLKTAVGARKISQVEALEGDQCNVAFTAGLLHDVGKLILAANAEHEYRLAMDLSEKVGTPLEQAELGSFGCTHAQIGAYLFTLWGFPEPVVQAVANHHTLEGIEVMTPALAIHVAQCLEPGSKRAARLNTELLERLGLTQRIEEWREQLRTL